MSIYKYFTVNIAVKKTRNIIRNLAYGNIVKFLSGVFEMRLCCSRFCLTSLQSMYLARVTRLCYCTNDRLLTRQKVALTNLKSTFCSAANRNRLLVLGIETSCDDTGAAVVNEDGEIIGEALNSQTPIHVE